VQQLKAATTTTFIFIHKNNVKKKKLKIEQIKLRLVLSKMVHTVTVNSTVKLVVPLCKKLSVNVYLNEKREMTFTSFFFQA